MYNILIVDDFAADRQILRDILLSFCDLDIEVTCECENGLKALAMIEKYKPDIVISDIEMPFCDGFELARNIRVRFPYIKIIFCSLYDEFEYAKRALYFGSYGYILKPIDPQELKQCISKVMRSISDEVEQQEMSEELEQAKLILEKYKPVMAEALLKGLINGLEKGSEKEIWDKIEYLQLPLHKGVFCLVYIEVDDYDRLKVGQTIENQQILSMKLMKKIKSTLSAYSNVVVNRVDEIHFICIVSFEMKTGMEGASKAANDIANRIMGEFRKTDVSLTLSVSSCCVDIIALKDLYEQCIYLMKHKFSIGKGKVIYNDEIPSGKIYPDVDFNSTLKEIRFLLNSGSNQDIEVYIEKLFAGTPVNSGEEYLKNLCFCVVICMQIVLNENNDNFEELFNSENLVWEKLLRFETILDARNWIKNILIMINEHFLGKVNKRNKILAEEVKKYIEKNYVKNFNLDTLAADLYYSSTYLNRVFKQETGETIYDFATKYRMEKTKEMLMDPHIRLYEISDMMGYSNPAYFGYVFKKYTGFTPKDYRERNLR